jgi:hypothetical protein
MALVTDVIDVPLAGGLAQHVDAKLVEPGAFLVLQNLEHTEAGGLRKRTGFGTMPTTATDTYTTPAPLALDVCGSELVMIGNRAQDTLFYEAQAWLWSWSPSLSKWAPRSSVSPLTIKRRAAVRSYKNLESAVPHVALCTNGVEVWVWSDGTDSYWAARDAVGGTALVNNNPFISALTKFCLFVCNAGATLVYCSGADVHRLEFDASTLTWGSDQVVYTAAANVLYWDAAPLTTTDYWAFSFYDSAAVGVRTLRVYTPTPTVTHNVVTGRAGAVSYVAIAANSAALVVTWYEVATGVWCYHLTSAALAALYAPIAVDGGGLTFDSITVGIESGGVAHVCWSSAVIFGQWATTTRAVTSAGAFVSAVRRVYHARPAGRPWLASDANIYLPVTGYLSDDHRGLVILCLSQHDETGYGLRPIKSVGAVGLIDGAAILWSVFPHPTSTGGGSTVLPMAAVSDLKGKKTLDAVTFNVAREQEALWRSAQASGLLLHSGGMLGSYDGTRVDESGFFEPPRWEAPYSLTYGAAPGVEGDAVLTHIYEYLAVYVYRDARGNIHRSAPSEPLLVSISNGGGFNQATVTLTIKTTSLSRRSDVYSGAIREIAVVVYRSLKNTAGAHYQIVWASTSINAANAYNLTVTDNEPDGTLITAARGQIYTDGGVFENWPPPPSSFVHSHGGRLWLVSTEDDREVWASKILVKDEPPAFSPYLRVRVEDSASEVVALGSLDDELVIFTRDHVYLLSGPGPNDAGGGDFFETPRLVSSSAGCLDARSVVSWNDGVFFLSQEGLCLLGRGGITWPGQAVKDTLASYPNIRHAQLDAKRRRITWLCDNGSTGVTIWFDYQHNAWGTFVMASDPRTICETLWSNLRIVGDTDGVHQEGYGSYPGRDPGQGWITARLETPWIRLGAVGGFQRVRRVVVTGDTLGSHQLALTLYNDWSTSAAQTETITQSTSLTGPERCVLVVASQKCSAVKIRLDDSAGSLTGEARAGSWVSGLSLEIGRKQGVAKLAPGSWK